MHYFTVYSILDKHRTEVHNPARKKEINSGWIKDYLAEYAESFPQVASLLEANIDSCIYGQSGFHTTTFLEMWNLHRLYPKQRDKPEEFINEKRALICQAHTSVQSWLDVPLTTIHSLHIQRFRKYILDKKDQVSCMKHTTDFL